ncbi:hypothetical protein J18TS1_02890 [Oceanobacillus oncorhynchi subsp. incaldanensis]|uniref:Uncharacterized protein n=2 Tax=Oceanobacillus TaxID=182709 RepID=A0A0A1MYB7_9BACI|nr:hypothetical protein [Oceanobacillus oncorhynchi]MDM8101614.1 hypothetical protein [Oceanobacillus oncorhynchi]UUI38107.1 hypothetical protein NP440_12145 [Oceanobacillus oncorhynchi]GIO17189.1 hypothetical protein J18TS1_02890 [Oceanobacillus oncorhynchi subsp. incaldanensis]CEI83761.1 hypothetical protein BN997_03682 [Oceanobacillus oncorhynchi]
MIVEKAILAVITTKEEQVGGGAPIFICASNEELQLFSTNLEAIMDGIAHRLSDEVYIIVKH